MARTDSLPNFLKDVADAIREKKGISVEIIAADFDTEIESISGGTPNLQSKNVTVTDNGTQNITADSGYDGLSNVGITANVQPSLQNKSITINENTTTNVSADSQYDGLNTVAITTNIQPDLETKSITITENTTTTITPTQGKDGLSSVSVTTNVSGGGSDLNWTDLGYTERPKIIDDGYDYAAEIKNNWTTATSLRNKFLNDYNLIFMPSVDTSSATDMYGMFNGCSSLIFVPLLDTSDVTDMYSMFDGCSALESIPLFDTSKVTTMRFTFRKCSSLKTIPILDTSAVTNFQQTFTFCVSLTDVSLDNILQMCIGATSYTGTKTLYYLGFRADYYPTSRIQALPHYQDFIDAGWTIGY